MKKSITKQEHITLAGLFYLAVEANRKLNEYDEAMEAVLGVEEKWGSIITDEVLVDSPNLKRCLKDMGVKVAEK